MKTREELETRLKELKTEKKEIKKQLNDLPVLEVGKWYTNGQSLWFVTKIDNYCLESYGIYMGNWGSNARTFPDPSLTNRLATDKEVETALIKEAKRRGFKEGMTDKFKCLIDKREWTRRDEFYLLLNGFALGDNQILLNGKWAEIIEPKTVYLPSGDYTKTMLTDIINNRFNDE